MAFSGLTTTDIQAIILGHIFENPELINKLCYELSPDDFQPGECKILYQVMLDLKEIGYPVEYFSVSKE